MSPALLERLGAPPLAGQRRLVTVLGVDALGTGLFFPFSVLYFTATTDLSLTQVGLALTLASAVRLPGAPVVGALVDRLGSRPVLLAANLLQGAGFLGFLVADRFGSVALANAVVVAGSTAFWGSYPPLVTAISRPGERERWFGFLGAMRNAGFGLGGLLAGLVVSLDSSLGYRLVVGANAASFLVAGALLAGYAAVRPPAREHGAAGGWRPVLTDLPYLTMTAGNVAMVVAFSAFSVAMPVWAVIVLRLPAWVPGAAFTLNCVLCAVAQGWVVSRMTGLRRDRMLVLAALLTLASCAAYAAADPLPVPAAVAAVLVATVLLTFGELVHQPISSAVSNEAAPDASRGRYTSVYQTSWGLAATIAYPVLTPLLDHAPLLTWAVLGLVALGAAAAALVTGRVLPAARWRVGQVVLEPAAAASGVALPPG